MTIQDFCTLYGSSAQAKALTGLLADATTPHISLQGISCSAAPLLFAAVAPHTVSPLVFVLQGADEAGYFYHDLTQALGQEQVLFFPSSYRRAAKYGQRDAANEILRTEVLARLASYTPANGFLYLVTYPEALAERVVSKRQVDSHCLHLEAGQTVDIAGLVKELRNLAFQETDYVYEPGQFALRGSILDVFSFSCEYPFRIDFFGDEIDTVRTFDVQDQLSRERRQAVDIMPELAGLQADRVSLLKLLPAESLLVMRDRQHAFGIVEQVYRDGFSSQALTERMETATEVERDALLREMNKETLLCKPTTFKEEAALFRWVEYGPAVQRADDKEEKVVAADGQATAVLRFDIAPQPLFHKNMDLLRSWLADSVLQQYHIYIFADSAKQHQRLHEIVETPFEAVDHTLHEGFVDHALRLCCFTDHQIFDRFHKYSLRSERARTGKMALTLKELKELEPGDFIVHVDLGIGRFGGLVRVPVGDSFQEVIRIIYQRGDKVDVSIHSLYKISKYRRQDTGEPPRLSTLGTGAWEKIKERTKKRIKDIARDLIKLYARRRHEKGFSFSVDTYLQQELEASFLYEDTPDQLKATQEVKADMERARPMDRLVCGDVGFGKTEVAIRAAFKAACDSKQVAVLVPTTVLAFQHYQSFRDRLRNFPVRVDYLSRARTAKQTRQVIEDLEAGRIDILVGTHKLISKQVKWKDLGLLIIDEEQKFGVATKEKLRTLKTNVDTLTLSATPIPRTLQFSLMGARDMSIIRTPPPNRYPIYTELATYGHEVIAEAINFEMSRNGQVFFVNDRISNLTEIARLIEKYVPDCRVVIGHGQMPPDELEKVIMGFVSHEYDVLLSTTIIENGIDIPNANTIIINDAHRFGLSDLHQMRGRVGRSNKKAFCYLLAPPKSVLSPEARRRLEALETFSELGSGFSLAMQDLDIRGAGNLLGAEQSGFMEDLGYETYQKILSQAVTELKNEEFQELYAQEAAAGETIAAAEFVEDCAVESDLEMFFPERYVPGSSERMLLYRELDDITDDDALERYRQRLIDRFGPIPHEGEELLQVVLLRRLGKALGCEKIMLKQQRMTLQLVSHPDSFYYRSETFGKVLNFMTAHPERCMLKEAKGRRLLHIADVSSVGEAVVLLKAIQAS